MFTSPLSPLVVTAPVLKDKLPESAEAPSLVDTDTVPELVAVPAPDAIVMEPPEDVVPSVASPPLMATAPPFAMPSPEARVKLPPSPVVEKVEDPAVTEAAPPSAPDESPAVTVKVPAVLVPEPTEIAMLPPEPDV